ncbi:hypothetical protein LZ30DRAFT_728216 [Colletotrichum cereale]|nr:hypothetical protein LZ30DRAFT_728216 [Colletotrichum cereale]
MEFKRKGMLARLVQDLKTQDRQRFHQGTLSTAPKFRKESMLFLKQVVGYCLAYRTKFCALSDLNHLILFEFDGLTINAGSTPVDVWTRGHGGKFRFTVLGKEENALKMVCYAGFLRKAASETPRDR